MKTIANLVFAFALLSCLLCCSRTNIDDKTLLLYARAKNLYVEGRFQETAAALSQKNTGLRAQRFVPLQVLRGKALYFSGDRENAKKAFKQALKLRPAQVEASLYMANILQDEDNIQEVEKIFETLLADDPSNIRVLRFAAEFQADINNENSAMAFLNRAVAVSEELSFVFLERARLLWIEGNGIEALSDLNKAKTLSVNAGLFHSIENLEKTILRNM
jgi:tetratricopeptide (TPR) repeat protein